MKFPFHSRYYAWKRRRAVRALLHIDRRCRVIQSGRSFSSSPFGHAQIIGPTVGGKTSYLNTLSGNKLGYPIRNYLPTSPGSTFVLGGGPMGRYSGWDNIVYPYPPKFVETLKRGQFIKQYYGKEKHVTNIYSTDQVGVYEDEYGNPVHFMARPKPLELGSITGYDINGEIVWTAELVVRFGTDNREQWISTNIKMGSFLVHINAQDAIKYHLDPHFMSKTDHIGARAKDGNHAYKFVYMSQLKAGKQADLAYAELTKNG